MKESKNMEENKNRYPHCGIPRRVAKGPDPVNYRIHFDDGYDKDDDESAQYI
jgi:hypothetical protein